MPFQKILADGSAVDPPTGSLNFDNFSASKSGDVTTLALAAGSVGSAELATGAVATADIAAGAVSGAKLATAFLKFIVFTGKNGAGACTATGTAVGDRVVGFINFTDGATGTPADFESAITVVNQIQQASASDYSAKKFVIILIAASA